MSCVGWSLICREEPCIEKCDVSPSAMIGLQGNASPSAWRIRDIIISAVLIKLAMGLVQSRSGLCSGLTAPMKARTDLI